MGIPLLVSFLILFAAVPVALAETSKGPWYFFVYGVIGYAALMVVLGLITGFGKKSK